MAFLNEYADVTCTWKIKNFSRYSSQYGALRRNFETTTASPSVTNITRWTLMLNLSYCMDLYDLVLQEVYWPSQKRLTQCECELSFLASDGTSHRYHKVLYPDEGLCSKIICAAAFSVPRSGIHKDKNIFLPQDTLTIRCRIWQLGLQSNQVFFTNAIRSESYLWNIEQFSNVQKVIRKKFELESFQFEVELHRDTLINKTSLSTWIVTNYNYSTNCQLKVDAANSLVKVFTVWFVHNSWKESEDISDILRGKCLANDTLSLEWQLTAVIDERPSEVVQAIPATITQTTAERYRATIRAPLSTLQECMLRLFKDGIFSDATISAGDSSFRVQKCILCSRSLVFRAMFEGDTTESRTGVVLIPDIEPFTLQQMLVYMYTDYFFRFGWKEALKLYYAADKYDIKSLKDKCLYALKAELSVDNACDLAVLADTHSDHGLMQLVVNFMGEHDEVICSSGWKTLEETNSRLTTRLLREMYVKKM